MAKAKSDSVKVISRFKPRLVSEIDSFMGEEYISERAEAVRRLVIAGLKYYKLTSIEE